MKLRPVWLVSCLIAAVANPTFLYGQQAAGGKFKITVLEDATQYKRLTKGRASSQTVVKVTDENDVPVAGIAVAFAIPHGGATFAGGTVSSVVTTSPAGVASSGTFSAAANASFNMSVTASTPGGAITISVPVNLASAAAAAGAAAGAGAGAGGGISGATIGILVAVGAAAAAGLAVGLTRGNGSTAATPPPTGPTDTRTGIRVGIGGPVTVGPRP